MICIKCVDFIGIWLSCCFDPCWQNATTVLFNSGVKDHSQTADSTGAGWKTRVLALSSTAIVPSPQHL